MKIRYAELPVGLHVSAEPRGRDTIIFLQPGLTASQRHAALARVRSSGRMGYGPRVSPVGMALAVSADKIRTTVRNGVAAMRGHPLLLLPPVFLLVSTIMVVPMSFMTGAVRQHERTIADLTGLVVAGGQSPAHQRGSGGGPNAGAAVRPSGSGRAPGSLTPHPGAGQSPTPSPAQSATSVRAMARPSPLAAPSPHPHGGAPARQVRPIGPGSSRSGPGT